MKQKMITLVLCACIVLASTSTPLFAKKSKGIQVSKLKGIETIAPITVVVDRTFANNAKEKTQVGVSYQSWGSGKLSEKEVALTEKIISDTLSEIESKSNAKLVNVDASKTLSKLPTKKAKKKVLVQDPYIYLKAKDTKSAAKAAKKLDVDAVALLYFKHKALKKSSSTIGISKSTKKYAIETTVIIVDKKGKVRAKGKIKPKYVKGRSGVGFSGLGASSMTETYFEDLEAAYTEALKTSIK